MAQQQQTAAMIAAQGGHQPPSADSPDAAQEAKRRYREQSSEWDFETSQRRRPLYKDVESLLQRGFLAHQVRVGSVHMSLRSFAPNDTFMLSHRAGLGATDMKWKTWVVATTLWMVDGVCLLEDPSAPQRMYGILQKFPPSTIDMLFSATFGLYNRTTKALMRVEAYCYEPYSRSAWRMVGRLSPSTNYSGVAGADRLGMNHVQRMWVAYNIAEDDRDQMLRDWSAAKLVASATSPKGIRKLNAADERLRTKEEGRRKEAIEKMVHTVLYGEHHAKEQQMWRVLVQGEYVEVPAVKVARTPEAMQEEFRAWVAGEKDWHDIIVDTYKDRIRAKYDGERQDREEALEDATRETGVTSQTHMTAYTLEQLQDFRPEMADQRSPQRRVFDNSGPARAYQKWVEPEVEPGRLRADEYGVWEAPIESLNKKSLHEQVADRGSTFSGDLIRPMGSPKVEDVD